MTQRATTLLAMAAAMAATTLPVELAAMPQPYQRRALRQLEKREPTAGDLERIAKAEAKRARKNAKRMRQKLNFVFLSGETNPLNLDASERRFMVVMDDVEPSNLNYAAIPPTPTFNQGADHEPEIPQEARSDRRMAIHQAEL